MDVEADAACDADDAVVADAVVDANEEPALGSWASGVMVVSSVSHESSGLRLRSRSPRPLAADTTWCRSCDTSTGTLLLSRECCVMGGTAA
jgi:hypothetical protein